MTLRQHKPRGSAYSTILSTVVKVGKGGTGWKEAVEGKAGQRARMQGNVPPVW